MGLSSRLAIGPLLGAVLAVTPAWADEIHLKGGGRVSGRIVERTATRVAIEAGPGRVTLPMSRVERIVEGRSALDSFGERARELDARDTAGWAELAQWAEERDLLTQARSAWQRVVAIDPGHPQANAGLGRVAVDGVWMGADDAYRARGFVSFEGRWLTPAEADVAMREREMDTAAARERREADLRVQEAEARVREAEARAYEAEAAVETTGGIPIGYGYGYGWAGGGAVPPHVPTHHGARSMRPGNSRRPRSDPGKPGVRPAPHSNPTPIGPRQSRPARPPQRSSAAILQPESTRPGVHDRFVR